MEDKPVRTKTSNNLNSESNDDSKLFWRKFFKFGVIISAGVSVISIVLGLVLSSFATLNPTEV